jgi:hypothetical protein
MFHIKDHPTSPRPRCGAIGGPSDGTHITNNGDLVDCPACLESMAKQVERRLTTPKFTFAEGPTVFPRRAAGAQADGG